jgi:para-nitrobenzyl esterase
LNLNIYAGEIDDGLRPVLVWLHPGGYDKNSANDERYDGTNLCLKRNVVVVTINHRLNGFGYMYLGGISPEYEQGNVGQLDIALALKWIRNNIHSFGGDKDSITLFGQAGGGSKISTLLAMPAAKGLFHRAWTMSGQQITGRTVQHAEQTTETILEQVEGSTPEEKLETLQNMSTDELRRTMGDSETQWTPVVDGISLPRDPFSPTAPELSRDVPMVLGNTYDETRNVFGSSQERFFNLTWDYVSVELDKAVRPYLGNLSSDDVVAQYRKNYPKYSPSDVFFAATTACRSWHSMLIEADTRARQTGGAPVWVYYFNWTSPYADGKWGASHGIDVPFVFANPDSTVETRGFMGAEEMGEWLSRGLTYFARDGKPHVPRTSTHWAPYTIQERKALLFGNWAIDEISDDRSWERKLFENVPYLQPGT